MHHTSGRVCELLKEYSCGSFRKHDLLLFSSSQSTSALDDEYQKKKSKLVYLPSSHCQQNVVRKPFDQTQREDVTQPLKRRVEPQSFVAFC